ncbi:MAG: hypothetical protein U0Q18_25425 [Bryobacteraceae bacterium]
MTTSPTLKRDIKKLAKTYRHIHTDLESLKAKIEPDYINNQANPDKLKMPHFPELQGKVWKYDCKSRDVNKHQRESMRLVCMFVGDDKVTLYGVMCFVRPNNAYIEPKEMARCLEELCGAIRNPDGGRDDDSDGEYETTTA